MFHHSTYILFAFLFLLITTLPIEIKDIQNIYPPQNTFLASNGVYMTKVDKQLGDEAEEKVEKACIPKSEAANDAAETILKEGFEDNSTVVGPIVDDPMIVKIYKPECDD
ncbi:unnamed protein product [Caenorhabditis bovis]|uniref:Uncharacterized protein n=1 Tax=Caenorhabditis bovis TaxID=2654633 RepID=A0A8S1F2P0_9PELO|nr:unnamed protein product [Caenorhabditis bovis]